MNIITTPNTNTAMIVNGGFARVCGKCAGTGIYYRRIQTPDGWGTVQDVCFPCHGAGHVGKVYATAGEFDKAIATADKARQRRNAKRLAESRVAIVTPVIAEETVTRLHLDASIGDTVIVTGTITVAISVDTQFGTSRLIVVETEKNESVKMFTTASWAWDANRDEEITVQGTVKSFDNYDGQAQTVLNRPKKIG
jgi:hypothetical protein